MTTPAPPGTFAGFPAGGFDFFLELSHRQDRDWFKTNKQRYERLWVHPLTALLTELAGQLKDVFPHIEAGEQRLFRIQRDTRFAADKAPYKTHVAAYLPIRPVGAGSVWHLTPGLYIHFGLDDSVLALGVWEVSKELLPLYRAAVDDAKSGARLQAIVDGLRADGFSVNTHEHLKRVPTPYPRDHPRGELLKHKGLSVGVPNVPEDLMPSAELLRWMTGRFRAAAPAAHWLDDVFKKR